MPVGHLDTPKMRCLIFDKLLPKVTQRMLTRLLRELEKDGLVNRKIYSQVPPKVEYSLTEHGLSLEPIIMALKGWGEVRLLSVSDD